MITALSHPTYSPLMRAYIRLSVRGHFRRVWLQTEKNTVSLNLSSVTSANLPVPTLLYATHVSWWDGYLMLLLAEHLRLEFRVMMLSGELSKYQFLRYAGAFGLNPNSLSDVRASLRYGQDELLMQPARALVMFPAGQIRPVAERPLLFKPGVAQLAATAGPVLLRPVAISLEHRQSQHPEAFLRLGPARSVEAGSVPMRELLPLLQQDLTSQADALASELRQNRLHDYESMLFGLPSIDEVWDFIRGKRRESLQ